MFDVTIIGCGVIGALLARKLSQYDLRILILERGKRCRYGHYQGQ